MRFSSDHTWRIGSALKMSPNMAESMIVEGIVETLDVGIGSGPDLLRMNAQLSAEAAGARESDTWKASRLLWQANDVHALLFCVMGQTPRAVGALKPGLAAHLLRIVLQTNSVSPP